MPDGGGALALAELLRDVRLVDAPAPAFEVAARLPRPDEPRGLSVSDLLGPRPAFWRRLRGPPPPAPGRERRREAGRDWHRRLGAAMAAEGAFEVRFRRGGITGRLDLLADVPVEIKTGSPARGPEDLRPEHVEQLASYCALTGRPAGRLVTLGTSDGDRPAVAAVDLAFGDLGAIADELLRRERALRSALAAARPDGLERCRWYGRGCEYRAAHLCDCRGMEAEPSAWPGVGSVRRTAREEIARRWANALAASGEPTQFVVPRFSDLIYPRRGYFARSGPADASPPAPTQERFSTGLYERVAAALERGPVGELHRLPPAGPAPEEEVLAWHGDPCLVRTSAARVRLMPRDVRERAPQYLADLGLRCATVGAARGRLVLAYERPGPGESPIQVLEVYLPDGGRPFRRLALERASAIDAALADGDGSRLPACPAWMAERCPYRSRCGCAADAGRSQR